MEKDSYFCINDSKTIDIIKYKCYMNELLANIKIKVNEKLYLKDPDSSDRGKSIVTNSILLIDEIGIEDFTFKKLGKKIGSPESTIYRYFESKHKVLLYLTSWYWCWLEYRLVLGTANISSSKDKLQKAIDLFTEEVKEDRNYLHINEVALNRIIIAESTKSYFTKEVDKENRDGLFEVYNRLIQRVSDTIIEINPKFQFPHMLVSTVIEGAHQQKYFAEHLPKLTDVKNSGKDISNFFTQIVFSTLENK